VRELAQSRVVLPSADELMPRLRERFPRRRCHTASRHGGREGGLRSVGSSASSGSPSIPTGGSSEALR